MTGQADAQAVASKNHRIAVANLDAVEQTRMWLDLGARQATTTILGALRTALLLADTVVVDRNQVLEGIFFVAMSPDRLAWHLGLPPAAPLPLTIGLLNPGRAPASLAGPGPWRGSSGPTWALPQDIIDEIDLNYEAVARDALRVSSPLIALTGDYDASIIEGQPSVNSPRPSEHWLDTDPAFLPQRLWEDHDDVLARGLIQDGRQAWVHAMKTGRVAVERWSQAPINIGPSLERARPTSPLVAELAEAIMLLEECNGLTGSCQAIHAWTDATIPAIPCHLKHVTKRSLLVRWLDGDTVDELSPPRLDAKASVTFGHDDRRAAFRWWNAAYYDAICARDDLRLLTLHNVLPSRTTDTLPDEEDARQNRIELAWGLRTEPQSRWRLAQSRLSRRSIDKGKSLGVEGEIVENLVALPPHQFVQLQRQQVVDPQRLWSAPTNRMMFDLALAVRELSGDFESRTTRLLINMLRVVALTAFAVTFALRDAELLPASGFVWVTTWIVLATVVAAPWGDIISLFKMSSGQLQSTLRLREVD